MNGLMSAVVRRSMATQILEDVWMWSRSCWMRCWRDGVSQGGVDCCVADVETGGAVVGVGVIVAAAEVVRVVEVIGGGWSLPEASIVYNVRYGMVLVCSASVSVVVRVSD